MLHSIISCSLLATSFGTNLLPHLRGGSRALIWNTGAESSAGTQSSGADWSTFFSSAPTDPSSVWDSFSADDGVIQQNEFRSCATSISNAGAWGSLSSVINSAGGSCPSYEQAMRMPLGSAGSSDTMTILGFLGSLPNALGDEIVKECKRVVQSNNAGGASGASAMSAGGVTDTVQQVADSLNEMAAMQSRAHASSTDLWGNPVHNPEYLEVSLKGKWSPPSPSPPSPTPAPPSPTPPAPTPWQSAGIAEMYAYPQANLGVIISGSIKVVKNRQYSAFKKQMQDMFQFTVDLDIDGTLPADSQWWVHSGTSCAVEKNVGGTRWYWGNLGDGTSPITGSVQKVTTPTYKPLDPVGYTIVITRGGGAGQNERVACGVIRDPSVAPGQWGSGTFTGSNNPYVGTASLVKYPGFAGSDAVVGSQVAVQVYGKGTGYAYSGSLASGGYQLAVHSGTTCANIAGVRSTYYPGVANPWPMQLGASGFLDASAFPVPVDGKVVVISNQNGQKVACGKLVSDSMVRGIIEPPRPTFFCPDSGRDGSWSCKFH